jgi:hypothetical protein
MRGARGVGRGRGLPRVCEGLGVVPSSETKLGGRERKGGVGEKKRRREEKKKKRQGWKLTSSRILAHFRCCCNVFSAVIISSNPLSSVPAFLHVLLM